MTFQLRSDQETELLFYRAKHRVGLTTKTTIIIMSFM